jgi:hypothetical protein
MKWKRKRFNTSISEPQVVIYLTISMRLAEVKVTEPQNYNRLKWYDMIGSGSDRIWVRTKSGRYS